MEVAELQAFISVADSGSFSLAAQRMHLTQPAVSKRIAALEARLDTRLFDRIGRRTLLTEAGRALLPRARRILMEMEDSRRAIVNLSGAITGRLSVGTSHHIGLHRLPAVLRRYTAHYPDVELDLRFLDSEAACAAVERGDIEMGIVTLPAAPRASLILTPIWRDPLSVVVARDHALTRKRKPTLGQLAQHRAILPAPGTFTRDIVEDAFHRLGVPLLTGLSTNYLETIRMMVSIGLGWSILPDTLLDSDLHPLHFKELRLERTLGVIQHPDRTLSNAARKLIQALEA